MNFATAKAATPPKPARIVMLPASAWHAHWPNAPREDVPVGIIQVSAEDVATAKAMANDRAHAMVEHDDREALNSAYNDALIEWAVARCTCDPNDATKPYLDLAESNARLAWTSQGMRRLFDELTQLTIEEDPTRDPIQDDQLARLASWLTPERIAAVRSPARRLQLRKLLVFVLDELTDP